MGLDRLHVRLVSFLVVHDMHYKLQNSINLYQGAKKMTPQQIQPDAVWEECRRALQAYRQEQGEDWGDVGEDILVRHLLGQASSEETALVEQQSQQYPKLREQLEFIQGIF